MSRGRVGDYSHAASRAMSPEALGAILSASHWSFPVGWCVAADGDLAIRPATEVFRRTSFRFFDRTRRSAIESALGSGEGLPSFGRGFDSHRPLHNSR